MALGSPMKWTTLAQSLMSVTKVDNERILQVNGTEI